MNLRNLFKRSEPSEEPPAPTPSKRVGLLSREDFAPVDHAPIAVPSWADFKQPKLAPRVTSDSPLDTNSLKSGISPPNMAQLGFFGAGAQFIGYQACAMLMTNWLIDKACLVPARDALKAGYVVNEELKHLQKTDEAFQVHSQLLELIHFGRGFGGRMVLFDVASENPEEWYKNPLNLDGLKAGQYRGMVQVDPNWCTPQLSNANLTDPTSAGYYEPDFWQIGDRLVHKSHLYMYVPCPVPDFLKPTYNYMGVPIPQRIIDRVYGAERSANEAPELLLTKRMTALKVGEAALSNKSSLMANLRSWVGFRNNFGIGVLGPGEEMSQIDTALGDVDSVIMTQYQLVASAANVPATKLLGTVPQGFSATGDYEARTYREELESIQNNDLTPLLKKHYEFVSVSRGEGALQDLEIQWLPLDSPTAKEWAEIDKIKADRDAVLIQSGVIDGEDAHTRLRKDKDGDYFGIADEPLEPLDDQEATDQ